MLRHRWTRLHAVILFLLVITACWEESQSTSNKKKEVKIRNKRDGKWSSWGPWGPCSRSCGTGIRTQTRQCQIQIRKDRHKSKEVGDDPRYFKNVSSKHCEGHSSRHHVCNSDECPSGTLDFRESQCKAFDSRMYMGKVYGWEAFIDDRTPCALTCRAKGFRFYATLNKTVIDGTPCSSNPLDTRKCITGVCLPIGCDGIAGSQRRLDRCGVCGGDNSTCRVVSGIFTRPQLTVGYNLVAHIPGGACNLNITQLRNTANRLALRKGDGTFILNGDWRLSWPGLYDGAGTKFQYSRQDPHLLESIVAAGPLRDAVDLLVLYQQPNPGIKYEYMLPLGDSSIPLVPAIAIDPLTPLGGRQQAAATYRPVGYVANPTAFNTISSFPQPASVQAPTSLQLYPGDSAFDHGNSNRPENGGQGAYPHSHHNHNHHGRRRGHHNPNKSPTPDKKFYWKVVNYTSCSEPCGGGTQRALVRCVKAPVENPVSDRRCAGEDKPIVQALRCNVQPCPAEWEVGSWSSCTTQDGCGEGLKQRSVFCQQRVSPTLTMRVAEGACLKGKPESQTKCLLKPCHKWEASEWSQCSTRCGNGVRRRQVICVDAKGKMIDPKDCDDANRPTELLACNMGPCDAGTEWFMSEFSECSVNCGGGVQTRHVVCSGNHRNFTGRRRPLSSEGETNSIEDEDESENEDEPPPVFHCDESKRPKDERECFSDKNCDQGSWFSGHWSECSASCGLGIKTRQVLCVLYSRGKFKIVEETLCPSSLKPEEKLQCESNRLCSPHWFSTEWSECSKPCGTGAQKRAVSCRSSNYTRTSSFCADTHRPLDKRSCNEFKCSKVTDSGGMVKDTSPNSILLATEGIEGNGSSSEVTTTTKTPRVLAKDSVVEDPEDSCRDEYRNCPLVVQARLCRYKYYKSVCCRACSEAQHDHKN